MKRNMICCLLNLFVSLLIACVCKIAWALEDAPLFAAIPGQVYETTSKQLSEAKEQFDRVVVMFHAPWCSACQRLKPKFSEAAYSFATDNTVRFLTVDATEELPLALQFDIQ
jgi:thiol-disulfide isomerase/thioredoxin